MARTVLLLLFLFLSSKLVLAGELFTEVTIDGHRCLVVEPKGLPSDAPLVLCLHGLGGNATNLMPVWPELHMPLCRVVYPDGIMHSVNLQANAFGWYYPLFKDNDTDIELSRAYLLKLVERFGKDEKGRPSRPVLFIGFSQGGVMSLEAGLHCPQKVLAIVSMSGYMPNPSRTLTHTLAPMDTPILLIHGNQDNIVPIGKAIEAEAALKEKGYKPILKRFEMGHSLTPESLAIVREFLKSTFPTSEPKRPDPDR